MILKRKSMNNWMTLKNYQCYTKFLKQAMLQEFKEVPKLQASLSFRWWHKLIIHKLVKFMRFKIKILNVFCFVLCFCFFFSYISALKCLLFFGVQVLEFVWWCNIFNCTIFARILLKELKNGSQDNHCVINH